MPKSKRETESIKTNSIDNCAFAPEAKDKPLEKKEGKRNHSLTASILLKTSST